jgi:hypothetical protein
MASRRLKTTGQGFSLFDLKDVISDVTDTISDALDKQGVTVAKDQLFLRMQALVQDVANFSNYPDNGYLGNMTASDDIPYSVAGDMVVIAYEHFKNNDKTDAIKMLLSAMDSDDFSAIANGLFLMNKKHENKLIADDDTEDTDDTADTDSDEEDADSDNTDVADDDVEDDETDNDDDSEDTDDTDTDDISDEEIENLVNGHTSTANDDEANEGKNEEDKDETEGDVKDKDKEVKNTEEKPKPMGRTSSELTASHTSKVLANKLSSDGSAISRARARDFIRKNRNL